MTWNIESDGNQTLEIVAERRQWRLDQLEQTTELLAIMVREAYTDGMEVSELARKARVSRPTIYRWIQHPYLKA
jgi:DNA invertase Pin-like site-specific DNA recombinase